MAAAVVRYKTPQHSDQSPKLDRLGSALPQHAQQYQGRGAQLATYATRSDDLGHDPCVILKTTAAVVLQGAM
jgi:hypothetical protein